jgi:hypothetical protein
MSIKLKDKIPNQTILAEVTDSVLSSSIQSFITETGCGRRQVLILRNRLILLTLIFLTLVIIMVLNQVHGSAFSLLILSSLGLYVAYIGYCLYAVYRDFALIFTHALTPLLAKVLNYQVTHKWANTTTQDIEKLISSSGLFNDDYNKIYTDDVYYLKGDRTAVVAEIKLEREEQRGEHLYKETLFHGSLILIELPRLLQFETYISTSGDRHGFIHSQFWYKLMGLSKVKEVSLEWNQFEKDLHVASSDQLEARTILSPKFMSDLHDWWLDSRENMRMVFRGNKLILMLPDSTVQLGTVTTAVDQKKIKNYLLSVLKPLWRTLTLAEDIKF